MRENYTRGIVVRGDTIAPQILAWKGLTVANTLAYCHTAKAGNTKGGSITVPLISCLIGLD
jgi:hypothetical protein